MKITDAIKRVRTDAIPIQSENYGAWLSFDRALGRALDEAKFLEERIGTQVRTTLVEPRDSPARGPTKARPRPRRA